MADVLYLPEEYESEEEEVWISFGVTAVIEFYLMRIRGLVKFNLIIILKTFGEKRIIFYIFQCLMDSNIINQDKFS